jgi:Ran-binding protein 3
MLGEQNQWKERGSGLLRLNRRKVDRGGARLGGSSHILTLLGIFELTLYPALPFRVKVMRKEAVYAVLLNVTLFRGMSCSIAQDPRYLRFSVLTPSGTMHYNLRVRFLLSPEAQSPMTKPDFISLPLHF